MQRFSKLGSVGLLGGVALASVLTVSALLGLRLMNASSAQATTPTSIALWQLKKDIQRDAVPVTGKTKNLRPPPPGEHVH